ncbi:hypothetical protein TNCV_1438811 [Trichonephila clavipes]|nr:hypothetical protein TNCV_1438811 [Trichonephila clavipes]
MSFEPQYSQGVLRVDTGIHADHHVSVNVDQQHGYYCNAGTHRGSCYAGAQIGDGKLTFRFGSVSNHSIFIVV